MEINNTFTSLIADLPYPATKNNQKESDSMNQNATTNKSFDGIVKNEMVQNAHEKEPLKSENSNSLNIVV